MRRLVRTIDAVETNDGDGVKIRRIGGRHRDHMGNEGVINPGAVQWMTAGKGVIHSEMPEQDSGLLHGFQMWLNLPSAEKMQPAAYQDIHSRDITELTVGGVAKVRAIAGQVDVVDRHLKGPLPERTTQPTLLDVELRPHAKLELKFDQNHGALVYVYHGSTDSLQVTQLGVFSKGETLALNAGAAGSSLLVMGGRSIGEFIVQHGPFVMNTAAQIEQAIGDYQRDQFV